MLSLRRFPHKLPDKMIIIHYNLRWLEVCLLCLLSISPHIIGVLSHESSQLRHGLKDSVIAEEKLGYDALYSRTKRNLFEKKNRDGNLPRFPVEPDLRLESSYMSNAHEVLRVGLQQFLTLNDTDLGTYLSFLVYKRSEPFIDEYGEVIRVYKKVFRFIWEQHNETLIENYAVGRFNKDKLDLCSVARYLSHQPTVEQRGTIMKRMGDALGYRCHPCTPYTPKEFGETIVPSTDDINPEGVSPEDSIILCKERQIKGQESLRSLGTSTTTQATITTTSVELVNPRNPSFEYIPCSYSNGDVVCDQVPLEEVQKVFKRTSPPRLASVKLILQPYIFSETYIPEDVFGTKQIQHIWIQYPNEAVLNRSLSLQVDADAFRSTKSYTNEFIINMIDGSLLDLGFLSGFYKLTKLTLGNIGNIEICLSSFPSLPRLSTLHFAHCSGMDKLHNFPILANGLRDARFFNDESTRVYANRDIHDDTVDRILDWLLISSINTLEEISISYQNKVTRVPQNITSFKALRKVWLHRNNIRTIKSGGFSFSVPVSLLSIYGNGIEEIEPGAFKGDFKDAEVYVSNNNLPRFEESVFGPLLQQMASGKGFINASYDARNPIDCSDESICQLSWLKNYEVGDRFGLNCSNGTSFKDLQPTDFNHCLIEYSGPAVFKHNSISPIENLSLDYTPCSISNEDVVCEQVPLIEIQKVFKRTVFPRLASVNLTLQPYTFSEKFIPEDVFGTKQILDIWIQYPYGAIVNRSLSLQVDANAFRSTKSYTTNFTIDSIDCTLSNLGFLSRFDKLTKLKFSHIYNIQHCLPSLPPLPRLISLEIEFCTGMNKLDIFPTITNGLKVFKFWGDVNKIDTIYNDETVDSIMDWLLVSSANTLEEMAIVYMNQVTRVPHKIASFKALRKLFLHDNNISTIKSETFSFSVSVSNLDVSDNGLNEIEPGAFRGDFKDAVVGVFNNFLTQFEESVFGPILQQMASGNGFIGATENPIDCSVGNICHLDWLRRYAADFNFFFKCSNGTYFKYLQPAGFNHCP